MSDDELPPWTLDEHLSAGAAAVKKIGLDDARTNPEPICHHFYEVNPVDAMTVSVEATYLPLCPRFSALGLEFLADRLEAWEVGRPNQAWLEARVPAVFAAAKASGLHYQGWTWEPRDRQPIGASDIEVINNRTA